MLPSSGLFMVDSLPFYLYGKAGCGLVKVVMGWEAFGGGVLVHSAVHLIQAPAVEALPIWAKYIISFVREPLLKGKAQYRWPPHYIGNVIEKISIIYEF
jgi:hypothetical protein